MGGYGTAIVVLLIVATAGFGLLRLFRAFGAIGLARGSASAFITHTLLAGLHFAVALFLTRLL